MTFLRDISVLYANFAVEVLVVPLEIFYALQEQMSLWFQMREI